jgi:iron complex outermembrane recepter protein
VDIAPIQVLTDYERSKTFTEFTPRASISYRVNDDANVYFSYGRGFKSGGFDMRGDAAAYPGTVEGYDPEIVDAYEIGLKADLLADRLTLATAVFDQEYQDQQVTTQFAGPPPSFVVSVVDNVGKSRIRGFELEAPALVSDALTANFSTSFLDTEFLEYFTYDPVADQLIDVADERKLQNTPDWMAFLGLAYEWPLGDAGNLVLAGSAAYRGDVNFFETPCPPSTRSPTCCTTRASSGCLRRRTGAPASTAGTSPTSGIAREATCSPERCSTSR